ncbi:uncharacterized protein LOC111025477 [Momordica charantia]|uniref:Uncharacterized protein LOC111025477 n=1 Tax=Momordica charantia TaxID=3673 RepID=A0A6J1DXI1_MOMCH|nr:uncharacterized protein LOC111025477 [Momordica charantia]
MAEIPANIKNSKLDLLTEPNPIGRDLEKRSQSKFYHFHKDHSHDISDCYDLKRQIEGLIQKGYFKKHVGRAPNGGGNRAGCSKEEKTERERMRSSPKCTDRPAVINMLVPYRISFSDEGIKGLYTPHNNALVVKAKIDQVTIRQILIDGGASTNILSFSTYLALE